MFCCCNLRCVLLLLFFYPFVIFCPFIRYLLIPLISFRIYRKECNRNWDCNCIFFSICLFVCRSLLLSYLEGGIWVQDSCYFMLRFFLPFIIDLFIIISSVFCCILRCFYHFLFIYRLFSSFYSLLFNYSCFLSYL